MNKRTIILSVLAFLCLCCGKQGSTEKAVTRGLLDALWMVESGGNLNPPDGDGGKAIGPYQIWKAYHADALEHCPAIGGTYEDCRKKEYAEQIIKAYMCRYAPKDATAEQIARIHNGGPKGHKRASTLGYWKKVQKHLR